MQAQVQQVQPSRLQCLQRLLLRLPPPLHRLEMPPQQRVLIT